MVWGRTSGGEELRGNRLVVNSQVIAYLPRNSLNMSCSPFIKNSSLEELCHKRLEFFSNTTTILVKLRNLSSDEHWNFTLTHVLIIIIIIKDLYRASILLFKGAYKKKKLEN